MAPVVDEIRVPPRHGVVHGHLLGCIPKLVGVARRHRWSDSLCHWVVRRHLPSVVMTQHLRIPNGLWLRGHAAHVLGRGADRLWGHLWVGIGRVLVGLYLGSLSEHPRELWALV